MQVGTVALLGVVVVTAVEVVDWYNAEDRESQRLIHVVAVTSSLMRVY